MEKAVTSNNKRESRSISLVTIVRYVIKMNFSSITSSRVYSRSSSVFLGLLNLFLGPIVELDCVILGPLKSLR